jgi:predicted DNA-binding transcriptional regulator AlpA
MEQLESPLVKVSEASRTILLEKPSATYDKIKRQVFPAGVVVRLGDRSLRFHRAKLLAWLENGGTAAGNGTSHGNESQVA